MTARIAVVEQRQLGELYELVLTPTFPERELVSLADLESAVESGQATVVAASDGAGWLGTAVLEQYSGGAVLLGYLAVGELSRGQGIGDRLLTAVKAMVGPERGWLLAEIELPGTAPERPEFGDPTRRAKFYQRAGAKALSMNHWQPPVTPEGSFVRLQLIALPVSGELGDAIEAGEVLSFERDYHRRHRGSAEYRGIVESIGNRRLIALSELSDLYG